jgi:hypothetical protein
MAATRHGAPAKGKMRVLLLPPAKRGKRSVTISRAGVFAWARTMKSRKWWHLGWPSGLALVVKAW